MKNLLPNWERLLLPRHRNFSIYDIVDAQIHLTLEGEKFWLLAAEIFIFSQLIKFTTLLIQENYP